MTAISVEWNEANSLIRIKFAFEFDLFAYR